MPNSSARHPYDHSSEVATRRTLSIAELAGFIDDLIKRREDVICKLNLDNWLPSFYCGTDRDTDNAPLRQRCIEDPFGAKLALESTRTAEDSPKCNIFTKAKHVCG